MGEDGRIDELLAKLRELDPGTWAALEKIVSNRIIYSCVLDQCFGYILQGVLQDAAAAKGKRAAVGTPDEYLEPGEIEAVARISWWADGEREAVVRFAKTVAEALLAAYIAALEAEAER